jgi:hypothetical protein
MEQPLLPGKQQACQLNSGTLTTKDMTGTAYLQEISYGNGSLAPSCQKIPGNLPAESSLNQHYGSSLNREAIGIRQE